MFLTTITTTKGITMTTNETTFTVVITMGDRRTMSDGSRIMPIDVKGELARLGRLYLDTVYTLAFDPEAGEWDGVKEGTGVLVGTVKGQVRLDLLRASCGISASLFDQACLGFIVQADDDTLVWAR